MITFFKAKCRKTGKYFAIEVEKKNGKNMVRNFVDITKEEADHLPVEYSVDELYAGPNLISCLYDKTRQFASTDKVEKRKGICRLNDRYDFQCFFCKELEIDYSGASGKGGSPYNDVGRISNLPASAFDRFGNPKGSQYDLGQDGSMTEYKVVILNLCEETGWDLNQPKQALKKKGFHVDIIDRRVPDVSELNQLLKGDNTQLWILSNYRKLINRDIVNYIYKYFSSGHGVWILSDNDPYFADANELLNTMFQGAYMSGNDYGDKVVSIRGQSGPGIISNHPIATGIVNFYEGITISTVNISGGLRPLVYSSENKIVTAYYDQGQKRALVDGGFTRLYYKWDAAGTDRFVVNAAMWLANIERFGYKSKLPKF